MAWSNGSGRATRALLASILLASLAGTDLHAQPPPKGPLAIPLRPGTERKGASQPPALEKRGPATRSREVIGVDFLATAGRRSREVTGVDFLATAGRQSREVTGVDFLATAGRQSREVTGVDFLATAVQQQR